MTAQSNRIQLAFAALILAMLPAVLDQTILATALPTVARDLGGLGDVSWVVSAYVVAATVLTPLWGKLADRHGHPRLLELAVGVFPLAPAGCCGWRWSSSSPAPRCRAWRPRSPSWSSSAPRRAWARAA